MKAVDFDYVRAATVEDVCRLLDEAGGDGKIIAGGQTLVPLLAMRLTRPSLLVDINTVAELQGIQESADALLIGSCTRQSAVEHSAVVRERLRLLQKGLSFVGHIQTRNRGTVGGSVANADPSAEIGLVMLTLGGTVIARSSDGDNEIPADEFFLGPMVTALIPNECLSRIRFPVWQDDGRLGTGFQEVSPRRSDFALASAAVQLVFDDEGTCRRAAVGIGGAAATPIRLDEAAECLIGTPVEDADINAAVDAIRELVEPESDLHATADYRRRLSGVMAARAVREAKAEALDQKERRHVTA
jgi:CO/xanthine dehydrogenase FAD-binding subunit